jgi:hypothetical protein
MFLQNVGQLSVAYVVLHLRRWNSSNTALPNLTELNSDVSETVAHLNHQDLLEHVSKSVSLII